MEGKENARREWANDECQINEQEKKSKSSGPKKSKKNK